VGEARHRQAGTVAQGVHVQQGSDLEGRMAACSAVPVCAKLLDALLEAGKCSRVGWIQTAL